MKTRWKLVVIAAVLVILWRERDLRRAANAVAAISEEAT